jgi:hypothetical protein
MRVGVDRRGRNDRNGLPYPAVRDRPHLGWVDRAVVSHGVRAAPWLIQSGRVISRMPDIIERSLTHGRYWRGRT